MGVKEAVLDEVVVSVPETEGVLVTVPDLLGLLEGDEERVFDDVIECVLDLLGVTEGVTDGVFDLLGVTDGVTEGVPDLLGVTEGVTEGVPDLLGVTEGVTEGVPERVPLGVEEGVEVCVLDGVILEVFELVGVKEEVLDSEDVVVLLT